MLRVIRDVNSLALRTKPASSKLALAIGNFDGLHRGHQAVIARMKAHAKAQGLRPALMTFEPHPRCYFKPDAPCDRLLTLSDKLAMAEMMGIEQAYVLRFNPALATMTADNFIANILVQSLQVRHVVTGADFVFGYKRGGNSAMLAAQSEHFTYDAVTPMGEGIRKFSSSDVRAALREGDMERVASILGRTYHWTRQVIHGRAKGRELGFPTANMLPPPVLVPRFGVYAVWCSMEGMNKRMAGVANLGTRPTIDGTHTRLEVHLLDRKIDLYDARLCVEFAAFIRPEQRFAGVDALIQQITKDCQTAKAILQPA